MPISDAVKYLHIDPWETAYCALCKRKMEGKCLLVRSIDDQGRLEELLIFCGVGCRIAYAAITNPDVEKFLSIRKPDPS